MTAVAILAGGRSRRFAGGDKALARLAGTRLIDHMLSLAAGAGRRLLIAGPEAYGTGLTVIADHEDGPRGPAAALWALAHALPDTPAFVTLPVDMPLLPAAMVDALEKQARAGRAAVLNAAGRLCPTAASWPRAALLKCLQDPALPPGPALHTLSARLGATSIALPDGAAALNINTRDDLVAAESLR